MLVIFAINSCSRKRNRICTGAIAFTDAIERVPNCSPQSDRSNSRNPRLDVSYASGSFDVHIYIRTFSRKSVSRIRHGRKTRRGVSSGFFLMRTLVGVLFNPRCEQKYSAAFKRRDIVESKTAGSEANLKFLLRKALAVIKAREKVLLKVNLNLRLSLSQLVDTSQYIVSANIFFSNFYL